MHRVLCALATVAFLCESALSSGFVERFHTRDGTTYPYHTEAYFAHLRDGFCKTAQPGREWRCKLEVMKLSDDWNALHAQMRDLYLQTGDAYRAKKAALLDRADELMIRSQNFADRNDDLRYPESQAYK